MRTDVNWAIIRHHLHDGGVIVDFYSGHPDYVGAVSYSEFHHHAHFESIEDAELAIATWKRK